MFHQIAYDQQEIDNLLKCLASGHVASRGPFTHQVEAKLSALLNHHKVLMTTSCTAAMEMAIRLAGLTQGDEVIVPTYTFPSTANAVLLSGATPLLAPVAPQTLSLTLDTIKRVRTQHTKAIMLVHYAGISGDLEAISHYCQTENLILIEDAAQALGSHYKGKPLGTFGDFGCFSFHQTKNETAGEGGALIITSKDPKRIEKAEKMLEKGTNRIAFSRGEHETYEWQTLGSSYAPSDLLMALLSAQLDTQAMRLAKRREVIYTYLQAFKPLNIKGVRFFEGYEGEYETPHHQGLTHSNAHLFYLCFEELAMAKSFYEAMQDQKVDVRKHFVPLHTSTMGKSFKAKGIDFSSNDVLFDTLIRLPLYAHMPDQERDTVIASVLSFFKTKWPDPPKESL